MAFIKRKLLREEQEYIDLTTSEGLLTFRILDEMEEKQ
jgi:hypothetical protein